MDFEFLPKLPRSNLDDRSYQDLIDECLLRIPRYCPEWTNYNPSDPGMTLVELFAWLTDQMLARFNHVPRLNYITFLELLGIRLQPPSPARVDVTFYLTTSLPDAYTIPAATEVATVRTQAEEAVIFSTDRPLVIAKPQIRHFLTADTADPVPQMLRDRFTESWSQTASGQWEGRPQPLFNEQPQPGNCFYLVLDAADPLDGNVVNITFRGEAASPTGINPDAPPRHWEAWNGETWEPILLKESDDSTKGFSFNEIARQGGGSIQSADVTLHLPQFWPVTQFTAYRGRWLRCTYSEPSLGRPGYGSTPRILGMTVRSVGGTVAASQCVTIYSEPLGISDGTPGQVFQLQSAPVLERRSDEYILVSPAVGLPQIWQEVNDFADSGPEDLHYTLDSITGTVQFGPLIREAGQIRQQTLARVRSREGRPALEGGVGATTLMGTESIGGSRQYGAVPPRGASIQMMRYRTGGGVKGNVQRNTIQVMKTAIPYVGQVVNHLAARNGADAESLESAAIRAPRILRTRDRAVTSEDFEVLAVQGGRGAVARSLCLPVDRDDPPGTVSLLLVPQTRIDGIDQAEGISPDLFQISPQLREQVTRFLDERKLLGIQIQLKSPDYVGVTVQAEVALEPEYSNPRARQEILTKFQIDLYRFLNPLVGGPDGNGWPFGRPVYPSDVVNLFQKTPGVLYMGAIQLFELRRQPQGWMRALPSTPIVDPGPRGLICSWYDSQLRSGHIINFL